jgi:hypothetical protein
MKKIEFICGFIFFLVNTVKYAYAMMQSWLLQRPEEKQAIYDPLCKMLSAQNVGHCLCHTGSLRS